MESTDLRLGSSGWVIPLAGGKVTHWWSKQLTCIHNKNPERWHRFTRYSDNQIHYEFEVEDPLYYIQKWGGEIAFNATDTKLYEYACHEGNYGLSGILAGYRRQEMDAKQ